MPVYVCSDACVRRLLSRALSLAACSRKGSITGDLQQLTTGVAVAHPLTGSVTPFLEFTTITNITVQQRHIEQEGLEGKARGNIGEADIYFVKR